MSTTENQKQNKKEKQPKRKGPKELTISSIEPGFVLVNYDISDHGIRWYMLHLLNMHGLRMKTESVYYGLFTMKLYEDIEKLKNDPKIEGKVIIDIVTPGLPEDQLFAWKEEYERKFSENFSSCQETLEKIEDMLQDRIMDVDDSGKEIPYTAHKIEQRIRSAVYNLNECEVALAKRVEREQEMFKDDEQMQKRFNSLGRRVREMHAFVDKLREANKKREAREGKTKK